MWYIVLLLPGWYTHCPFLCCGQLECAFVGAHPSLIDISMPPQNWAWLILQGTSYWLTIDQFCCTSVICFNTCTCLAHDTFVLKVVKKEKEKRIAVERNFSLDANFHKWANNSGNFFLGCCIKFDCGSLLQNLAWMYIIRWSCLDSN